MIQWDKELWLLNEEELEQLADGVTLKSIGQEYVTKTSILDRDTRFGHLAFGLTAELVEDQNLKHKFLLFLLKS